MKTILMVLFLLLAPLIFGYGAVTLVNIISGVFARGKKLPEMSRFGKLCISFPVGVCITLLLAGITNVLCVFLHMDLEGGRKLFAGLLIAVLTVFYFVIILTKFSQGMKKIQGMGDVSKDVKDDRDKDSVKHNPLLTILTVCAVLLSVLLIFFCARGQVNIQGDQTLETVNSFLSTGKMYDVDPLTGTAYSNGFPSRLSLMCLPFLYAVLCGTFSVSPMLLVWHIIPAYFLLAGFGCFVSLGEALFTDRFKKTLFYIICVLLLLCTNVSFGGVGFDILHTGFRSSAYLNLILLNLTFYICIKKKWICLILPIILEPLIASTAFGIGACFFAGLVIFVITRLPFFKKITRNETKGGQS